MTRACPNALGGWTAEYQDRDGHWRIAKDARFIPIRCETAALALAVAWFRRRRLKSFASL